MTLKDLLKEHKNCRQQLIDAINSDAEQSAIQAIDARLTTTIKSIENLQLHDPQDIVKQIRFFLSQSEDGDNWDTASANLKSVDTLVSRYLGERQTELGEDRYISSKLKIAIGGQDYTSKEMIQPKQARVSLFNTEFRYQFTSIGNANFYDASPSDFVGKHVLDVIGEQRFAQRAKARFESCFSGTEQRYFHFLPDEGDGERLMDCHMAPFYDSGDAVCGAYVAVEDITEKIENARQLQNLN